MVLYLLIFFYRCAIRGDKTVLRYIGCIPPRYHSVCANQGPQNRPGGRRMRAEPLWSFCRILPTAVLPPRFCVSGGGDIYFCTPLNPTFILRGMVMVVGSL